MSAVILSETSIKSDPFRYTNQQMFTIGCGQSLAKHWPAVVGKPMKDDIGAVKLRAAILPLWSVSHVVQMYYAMKQCKFQMFEGDS